MMHQRWLIPAVLFAAACRPDAPRPDSAGTAAPAEWRIAAEPRASIGIVDGDERYQLVSVSGAWQQSNGRIVVLDAGKSALQFFDSTGVFLHQTGSRGEGPGEMQRIVSGWPYRGDSIATYYLMLRRISVYDPDGAYVRSFQNPLTYERKPGMIPSQSCCLVTMVLSDGSFIGHPPDDIPTHTGPTRYGRFTPWLIPADGSTPEPIGTFDSRMYEYDAARPNRIGGYAANYAFRYVAIGEVLIGGNDAGYGLLVIRPGVSIDTIPTPQPAMPFKDALKAEFESALRADYEARGPSHYEGTLESNLPERYPPLTPSFVNMQADADGHAWLQRWTPSYGREGARLDYDLITARGRHVATIELPVGSRMLWAKGGRILLLQRDSMDVQYVRLYDVSGWKANDG